nr:hypothetical protein [Tanacetum cinerariifolium]
IGNSNFRLRSDLKSKESTLQVVYDVLKLTSFYNAFLITTDAPEIYMQEFWTTATVHHHSIHLKINNKKHIVNLEYFREMLQICPRIPNQQFEELPFEEAILTFLRELGHRREIKMITDVNVNKMHQPWRSFAAVINKCLSGKTYKEYYAIASGAEPPKTKASVKKKQVGSDTTMPPPTAKQKNQDFNKGKEESFDPRVHTLSHVETINDEDNDKDSQDVNVKGDELDEEEANEEDEGNELYRDVNINLEGQQQSLSVSSCFSNMLNPSPDIGIDSIFNFNIESTSQVDVLVTTTAEPPLLSVTILPPPSTPIITHLQQTPVPSPVNVPSSSIIIDKYLDNQMNEAVKVAVQLQLDRLKDEAQAKNDDFLNKLDENIKKIIKEQVKVQVKAQVSKILPKIEKTVNEQLKNEVLTRSSSESKTSHAIAANLCELELKKILIDKMERNKSIYRFAEQKNLHKALVEAYESDKLILDTDGYTVTIKRCRDDQDEDEEPSARSNRGSKRRRAGKEPESTSAPKEKTSMSTEKSTEGSKSHHKSAPAEEPKPTAKDLGEPTHQEFITVKPPTLNRDWNNTLPTQHRPVQPWLSNLARKDNFCNSFNELMDTPLDFSAFVMNRLKVDTLTPELLTGPIFQLMKGSCKSLVELEYFFEEVYKATTDQLDWNNPEGQHYPHDL